MRESLRSDAVQLATGETSGKGVSFGDLETRLGRDVPSVRGRHRGERILRVVRLIVAGAPLIALLAPLGIPGTMGGTGPGVMPWLILGQPLETLTLICFAVSLSGQTWVLLSWWHLGRRRDRLGPASSVLALVAGAVWLVWLSGQPPIGGVVPEVLNAPIGTTILLAALALAAQLFFSRPGTVEQARARVRGQLMRALPPAQQQALLAERQEVLETLRTRGVVDRATVERAAALPLGDWWSLDSADPAEARHSAPHSLANSTILLRCLKALALVAPFGMVLLPIGNPGIDGTGGGMRSVMQSDGFRGDTLVAMAMFCAVLGLIGQVWTIFDWWRLGRRRDGLWLAWSWTALGSSVATLFIFPFFLTRSWRMEVVTGPIIAVAVTAAVALVVMYAASVPGSVLDVRKLGRAEAGLDEATDPTAAEAD